MGLQTYEVKLRDRTIGIKAKKQLAEGIAGEFKKVLDIRRYSRELCGVVGRDESKAVLWSPFGPSNPPTDEAAYERKIKKLVASLPAILTIENSAAYIAEARAIFNTHIPVVDKRRTMSDETIRQAEVIAVKAQQEMEHAEWRAQFCQGEQPVSILVGMMAVYLELTYDDSDSRSDYYAPHCQIGDDILLAIVPKQAERETLARRILALYPELAKLTWEWKTENYSMGHGNYLISGWIDHHEDVKAYDGREKVSTRYEIRFNSYQREMWAYRDYPGKVAPSEIKPSNGGSATIRRNEEHNGIEVLFPAKPEQAVLDSLKALGFRWSKHQSLWYARYTEALLGQVRRLLNPVIA